MRFHLASLVRSLALGLALLHPSVLGGESALALAVQQRLEAHLSEHRIPGGAVAVLHRGTFHSFVAGIRDRESGAPVTEQTLFPIGSVTKVFTGVMLAHLVNEGTVSLNDRVTTYLPEEVRERAGALNAVTLLDLATHTSGMTDSAPDEPAAQVYYDLPPEPSLIADWITWTPTPPVPPAEYRYDYSNKGFLTLAFAVADAGKRGGYNPLFAELFRTPLDLTYLQTRGTMGPEMLSLVTRGYGDSLRPNPNVGHGVNANLIDLEPLLRALQLDPGTPSPLKEAIAASQRPTRSKLQGDSNRWIGLGWDLDQGSPYQISKNGATAGVFSLIRLYPQERFAVAVMLNGKAGDDDESGTGVGALAREIFELAQSGAPPNLARDRPTRQFGGRRPGRANDGDKSSDSFWDGDAPDSWWQVDLQGIHPIGRIAVLPSWTGETPQPYTIWTSLDEQDWRLLIDQSEVSAPSGVAGDHHDVGPLFARFVRLQRAGGPLRLVELEVFPHSDLATAALHQAQPSLTIQTPSPGQSEATYSFTRLVFDPRIRYQALASRDWESWAPLESYVGPPSVTEESAGLSERVTWRLSASGGSASETLFLRLRVDRSE